MTATIPTEPSNSNVKAVVIIAVLFFIFGFVSWLNAILIPYFKLACNLSTNQAMLVAFAFYISYFVMAIPSAAVLKMTGLKNGMSVGLLVMVLRMGHVGKGAQRWLELGGLQLQPSELMKIALILALARYFHCLPSENSPLSKGLMTDRARLTTTTNRKNHQYSGREAVPLKSAYLEKQTLMES